MLLTYFCAKFFRHEQPIKKQKKGAVILVGGGDGHLESAHQVAGFLLRKMNAKNVFPLVSSFNTTQTPAMNDHEAVTGAKNIAHFFNSFEYKTNA